MDERPRMVPRRMAVRKDAIKQCCLIVLFKAILDCAYVSAISPLYSYAGFTLSIDPWSLIDSYLLTLLIGAISPSEITKPSDFLVWMLSVGTIVPTLSYYAMHSGSRVFMYWMCFCLLIVMIASRLPYVRIRILKQGRVIGALAMVSITIAVAMSMIAKGGLRHFNLAFGAVYEHRRDVKALIAPGLWAYLNTWVLEVINPALIALALWQERHRLVPLLIGLQIAFFGISSDKAVVFYPILVMTVFFAAKQTHAALYLTRGLIGVVLLSLLASLVLGFNWPLSLFVRRSLFIPAQLNFVYHDLFSDIGHVYLSNSILSGLVKYPFSHPPEVMVSQYLYGGTGGWCNNGFMGSGYMHFGYVGMLMFSVVVGLLLKLADSLTIGRMPVWLGISIVVAPFRTLFTSADLFAALMTHGIIVAFVIMMVIASRRTPRDKLYVSVHAASRPHL